MNARRSFVRIELLAKETGIGSLRIGAQMWNCLPSVEQTAKIPPSMMLQPWMGSDFTNDELVKESSVLDDSTHERLSTSTLHGQPAYQVRATPKAGAASGRSAAAEESVGYPMQHLQHRDEQLVP